MRAVFVAMIVLASAAPRAAHADPATDTSREVHLVSLGIGGVVYLGVEIFAKSHLAPEHCRICEPTSFDVAASRAIIWDDTKLANVISTIIGYAGAPLYAMGTLYANGPADRRRKLDDAIPVLESGISIGLLHHIVKFTVGRQRPFVHHYSGADRLPDDDDNASLFSGHTGLAFAVATAAGVVAHERHYAVEPYVWVGGYAIAIATGYLRIAADKHWLSDVVLGAAIGVIAGVVIPITLHGDTLTSPTRVDATSRATPRDVPRIFSISIPI